MTRQKESKLGQYFSDPLNFKITEKDYFVNIDKSVVQLPKELTPVSSRQKAISSSKTYWYWTLDNQNSLMLVNYSDEEEELKEDEY